MKVLHVYNRHRGGGGADNAWDQTISYAKSQGLDIQVFERDSKALGENFAGKAKAFAAGIYAQTTIKEFSTLLAEFEPDVVHAHELMPLVTPWILPQCSKAGVPVVYTYYDYRLTCPVFTHYHQGQICHRCEGGREYQAILHNCRGNLAESTAYATWNTVARWFDLHKAYVGQFVVLSEFGRGWLQGQGIANSRINVIPCAVPLQSKPVDPAQGQYIAYAGRFVPEKGVEVLVAAARKAQLPVKLAGNFASHPAIKPGDCIECVSINNKAALADFYRHARMLVVPSTWYETFGIVAAEAMSHGVPVVASRIGALQYTVQDGESGLLFEMGNVDDLADKMALLWHDDELVRRLGQQAFLQANSQFNLDVCFKQHLAVYEKARQTVRHSVNGLRWA
jgi:glycosyltransferase involved in cell wall biosynthesis